MIKQNANLIRFDLDENNGINTLDINGHIIDINGIETTISNLDRRTINLYDITNELNEKVYDLTNELKTTKLKLYALIATSFIFSILLFFIK